jgi:hypothetical protein
LIFGCVFEASEEPSPAFKNKDRAIRWLASRCHLHISNLRQQLNGDTVFTDFFSCLMHDSPMLDIPMMRCDIPREQSG